MEQAELRQWESKCVQDEKPRCVAACPLHVDVKAFCSLLGQRRVDKAWQTLAKTLPLPGVLARLCHGPCKDVCIREQAGGSVQLDTLERFCAENAKAVNPPRPLPSRNKSVAVLGGGMTGLCAAWELARRGFDVALHCDSIGAELRALPETVMPEGILDAEIAHLKKLGVSIHTESSMNGALLDSLREANDAIFLDSDDLPESMLTFGEPDELTLGTTQPGVFASRKGEGQAIFQAATGRRAANSIERFTQGVSMVTGRELEGPYETRLYTALEKIEPIAPVECEGTYTEAQARDEAKRCLQCECMECVKSCEYLKHFKQYPKVYARQIYNNESIVMGTRQANTMINSCTLCGLCETICPEDFSMADVCLEARRTLVKSNHMPPSAHEFALRDMAFANGDKSALCRNAPGTEFSEYVFFPGCQLTASNPSGVEAAYADLRARLGNVGIMLQCCGAPAEWAGRETMMQDIVHGISEDWKKLGNPKIIAACPSCVKTLKHYLPEAEIVSHWSILRAIGLPKTAKRPNSTLAINDPCAARHDAAVREDVRSLLESMDIFPVEPELTGEYTQCCGYGGLLAEANPKLGEIVAEQRANAVSEDYVTYCAMCRDMFARTGKNALHIYDLLYPQDDSAAKRQSPGYSVRRENRARLRENLLKTIWNEALETTTENHELIAVQFSEEAARIMEERRILKTDVQKVLHHVEQGGGAFLNTETGHLLASFRPVVVTYWVEFEKLEDGYLVHNTWCHRMRIKGVRA